MSGPVSNRIHYHDPYANLAAAILETGVRCNDTSFLESEWADILRELCSLDDEMYGDKNMWYIDKPKNIKRRFDGQSIQG